MKRFLLAFALLFGLMPVAFAAPLMAPCTETGPSASRCDPVNSTNPLPVSPSIGGSSVTPLTPMQTALAITSSTALTVPTGATYAVVCARSQNVNYTTDGTTTPTASVGMQLLQNQCVPLQGATTLSNFRAIQQAATATLDVSYFK